MVNQILGPPSMLQRCRRLVRIWRDALGHRDRLPDLGRRCSGFWAHRYGANSTARRLLGAGKFTQKGGTECANGLLSKLKNIMCT